MKKCILACVFVVSCLYCEEEENALKALESHAEIISALSREFGVSSRLVASVIYAERRLNYNWSDALLDGVLSESGYNGSVGFAQVKVNTAFWIEEEINNAESMYYLGKMIGRRISRSSSRSELVAKLLNDSTNLAYCTAYIAMIKHRWHSAGIFLPAGSAEGIYATLYSLGVFRSNGEERGPHHNPRMNKFGMTAQDFYDSFTLLSTFPK